MSDESPSLRNTLTSYIREYLSPSGCITERLVVPPPIHLPLTWISLFGYEIEHFEANDPDQCND